MKAEMTRTKGLNLDGTWSRRALDATERGADASSVRTGSDAGISAGWITGSM